LSLTHIDRALPRDVIADILFDRDGLVYDYPGIARRLR
jgi:hypothetical protein